MPACSNTRAACGISRTKSRTVVCGDAFHGCFLSAPTLNRNGSGCSDPSHAALEFGFRLTLEPIPVGDRHLPITAADEPVGLKPVEVPRDDFAHRSEVQGHVLVRSRHW